MNPISPSWAPRRVPPVDVGLLASAIFIFSEYVGKLAAEGIADHDDEDEDGAEELQVPIDPRAVLDHLAEELGTDVTTTLNVYFRITALLRLLSSDPDLASIVSDAELGEELTPEALMAAATLDLHPGPRSERGRDFDPREFREALDAD
jgi:hypothetical protein